MHLQGQYGRDNGGAIYANGNINITESVFKNNEADDDDGGAVYCTGNMYIFHTLFESNKAYVDGGAVFCEGKITAKYSRFAYNKASGATQRCFGGAVRSEGACYIDSAYFSNNYAEDYGVQFMLMIIYIFPMTVYLLQIRQKTMAVLSMLKIMYISIGFLMMQKLL